MLSYLPPEAEVDEEGLANGCMSNPHGHGWAIAANGLIVMRRSLNADEALTTFVAARSKYRGPALFHSRLATHGSTSVGNVHPFMVGGSHMTVVGHNGILPDAAHPAKGDDRSDTRKFAEDILPARFRHLDERRTQKELAKWCGSFNKLVILTVDPRYAAAAYIVNQDCGQWCPTFGIWHSNADYRDPFGRWYTPAKNANVSKSAADSAEVFDERGCMDFRCDVCEMGTLDRNKVCDVCGTCAYCYEYYADCACGELADQAVAEAVAR